MQNTMKKLCLTAPGKLEFLTQEKSSLQSSNSHIQLKVNYCGVCRTDAKMWEQGHRDLSLPRVLGHEFVGVDEQSGKWYTLWPGQACGSCSYCQGGRENLCDQMSIIGFHADGGFADYATVPRECLFPIPETTSPHLFCFAEPVACVVNAFSSFNIEDDEKIVIYGGGVLGLCAALVAKNKGLRAVVIEQSAQKIEKAALFTAQTSIEICKDTVESNFDYAINCCDSVAAFNLCLTKLKKGGELAYFSGVSKKEEISFSLLNLIHYKEIAVFGFYGPRKEHVAMAVQFCDQHLSQMALLVEELVGPADVPNLMEKVLDGTPYKYIVDFSCSSTRYNEQDSVVLLSEQSGENLPETVLQLIKAVKPVDGTFRSAAQKKIDLKTKPLGALGRVEKLAVSLSLLQNSLFPVVRKKKMLIFAGDHGVVEEGVSAFPAKVTVQMVENFLAGGAAINVFCKHYNITLSIVDMGVNGTFALHPFLIDKKVARGTNNFAVDRAMSIEKAVLAIEYGAQVIAEEEVEAGDVIGLGEMGIGNTTSATAVISVITGKSIQELTGRGTGVDDEGLKRKIEVLEKALAYHCPDPDDIIDLLSRVGGFELGGICGAVLAAASRGCCVVLDGIISTAAGLLAYKLCPEISGYLVAGHRSVEHGQAAALEYMGLEPVVNLNMRLGEGTGAAVTINMLELAAMVMCDMASFEEAGVDVKI